MLPQGWFPPRKNWQDHRFCNELWDDVTPGLFLRLSSNLAQRRRQGEDKLHNSFWHVLLPQNAQRPAQRRVNILHNDEGCSERPSWKKHSLIRWWYSCGKQEEDILHLRSSRNLHNMHESWLKLNPEKCVFRVTRGKVLGCLVSTKGIKANPDKIRAILQMHPPQKRKRNLEVN
jgi:hypothetical protein